MEEFVNWITENRKWLFSGIGVLAITVLYKLFKSNKSSALSSKSIKINNKNSDGNINVYIDSNNSETEKKHTKSQAVLRRNYSDISKKIKDLDSEDKVLKSQYDRIGKEGEKLNKKYDSEYKDIIDWLAESEDTLIERSYEHVLSKLKTSTLADELPVDKFQVEYFYLEMSNLLKTVRMTLLVGNRKSIDEPRYKLSFKLSMYETAMKFIYKRVPLETVSQASKIEFKKEMKYALSRF